MHFTKKYLGFATPSPPRALSFFLVKISIAKRALSSLDNTDYSRARERQRSAEREIDRERKRDKASSSHYSEIEI
jgi:hypothetical protein